MELAVDLIEGIRFDLRAVLISLAGMFGGPFAALLAGIVASLIRFSMGGEGMLAGLIMIGLAVGLGSMAFFVRRRWGLSVRVVLVTALVQAALPVLTVWLLPEGVRQVATNTVLAPFVLLTAGAWIFAVLSIERSRYRGWFTHLMKVAMSEAPDYFYIKDREGRIVASNEAAARVAGRGSAADITGLTDFELAGPERAEALFEAEQAMLKDGGNIVDHEEQVTQPDGSVRTYVTTKRSIFNADGSVAGLVGVTKDLTDRLALERKFTETRAELDVVLNEMSDGLARFDQDCRLVFSNSNYQSLFPLTGALRQPGAHIRDILEAVLTTGEQQVTDLAGDDWIAEVTRKMQHGGEEQVKMYDGRWLLVRSTPLRAGGTVVIVSDISGLKEAESNLIAMAEQMRVLATTDALTGLHNRRDFDNGLVAHFERAQREGDDLAVVLLDIDRFKAYNDSYGHPAGDACLRRVAACIRDSVKRPADMAARFGGEEFAVLLPNTDLAGAQKVADDIRRAVEAMQMPHQATESGYVTISAGVAALGRASRLETGLALVEAADRALYAAKAGGRNQVIAVGGF